MVPPAVSQRRKEAACVSRVQNRCRSCTNEHGWNWQYTYMSCQIAPQSKARRTHVTDKRALLQMHRLDMLDHIAMQRKTHMTSLTCMLALAIMTLHVAVQVAATSKARAACLAHKRSLAIMRCAHMLHEKVLVAITGVALFTLERATVVVHGAHVLLHV